MAITEANGGWMMVVMENEPPNRRIGFSHFDIAPRGYDELMAARLHEPITLKLDIFNGKILDTDIKGVDCNKYVNISTTLDSHFTSRAIGLVEGGWLPSSLAATQPSSVVLLDRNIITDIIGRFRPKDKPVGDRDFLDLFADRPIRLNPMLFALEGNSQSEPGSQDAAAQLQEAIDKLRVALPKAELMVGPQSLDGLLGILGDTRAGMARRRDFLMRVVPALASPVARRNIPGRWKEILTAADECNLERSTLVVLAALSALVAPQGESPAIRLLKPKQEYASADAYNALCDLRSLELLVCSLAFFPEERTQLCTADKNLALFWCGLQLSDITRGSQGATFKVHPHLGLFPAEFEGLWQATFGAEAAQAFTGAADGATPPP